MVSLLKSHFLQCKHHINAGTKGISQINVRWRVEKKKSCLFNPFRIPETIEWVLACIFVLFKYLWSFFSSFLVLGCADTCSSSWVRKQNVDYCDVMCVYVAYIIPHSNVARMVFFSRNGNRRKYWHSWAITRFLHFMISSNVLSNSVTLFFLFRENLIEREHQKER